MRPKWLISVLIMLSGPSSLAKSPLFQGHLRTGLLNGTFTGVRSGDFSVPLSFDGEGEFLMSPKDSLFVRATVALEPESGQFKYVYMGTGQKFYFFSRNAPIENFSEGNVVQLLPKNSYYISYDIGISQIQVERVTDSLTVESTLIDFGVTGGYIYQLSKRIGISVSLGFSKGFPVSPVSVDSTIIRALVGVSSYF